MEDVVLWFRWRRRWGLSLCLVAVVQLLLMKPFTIVCVPSLNVDDSLLECEDTATSVAVDVLIADNPSSRMHIYASRQPLHTRLPQAIPLPFAMPSHQARGKSSHILPM